MPRFRSCPTSTPSPTTVARSGRRCCPPSSPARCAGSSACRRSSSLGVTEFAELGPGGVLTGMAKRSVASARTISVATPEDLDKLLEWVGGDTAADHPSRRRAPVRGRAPRRIARGRDLHTDRARVRIVDRRRHAARPRRRARGPFTVPRDAAELHRRRHRTGNAPSTDRVAAFRLTQPTVHEARGG